MQFMSAALVSFPKTFDCDSRLIASTLFLIGLSSTLLDLIVLVGAGSILRGTEFGLASSLFALHAVRDVDLVRLFHVTGQRWLPYDLVQGLVSEFSSPGQARVVVNRHDTYTGLPPVPCFPCLGMYRLGLMYRDEAARYFHHVHDTRFPGSFLNKPGLLDTNIPISDACLDISN